MVSTVILAAGKGTRMQHQQNISKQHIDLYEKSVLQRTLEVFLKTASIDEIVLVISEEEEDYVRSALLSQLETAKPIRIAHGGAERVFSAYQGICATDENAELVLIHDGVRPFVRVEEIEGVIQAARAQGAAVLAVPAKDTIKLAVDGVITHTPDRSQVYQIQTPQGFRRSLIQESYERLIAAQSDWIPTDDASVAEHFGYPVHIVQGSYENIKITTASDLAVAEAFLRMEAFHA